MLELFSARRKHEGCINICFNRRKFAHFINAGACDVNVACVRAPVHMHESREGSETLRSKRKLRTTDVMTKIVLNFKRREVGGYVNRTAGFGNMCFG